MLELYHNINSVCAQKVRIALKEKGQEAKEHLLTLQGDKNDPAYLKLNPNGVVPTLVHDGNVIVESSLILYEPGIANWWGRVQKRDSVQSAIFDRMQDPDWAPFENLAPDPWPKVQTLLQAA